MGYAVKVPNYMVEGPPTAEEVRVANAQDRT
jgi:hypothetical protein